MASRRQPSNQRSPEGLPEERMRELAREELARRVEAGSVDIEAWKLENWIERARNELHRDSQRRLAGILLVGGLLLALAFPHLEGLLVAHLLQRREFVPPPPSAPVEAVLSREVPLGTILAFAGEPDQKELFTQGFMLCNGQRLVANTLGWSREEFDALYRIVGTAWGGGVTATGQRFLHLPDLRGIFLRGVDSGAGKDLEASRKGPDGADLRLALYEGGNSGDRVGSYQGDTVGRPEGFTRPGKVLFYACTDSPSKEVACPPLSLHAPRWFQNEDDEKWIEPPRGPQVDTRPKNAAVHWIVRVR